MSDLSKRLHEKHAKHNPHRCHSECTELLAAAEIEALEARVAEQEQMFGNVLALIHRDGGHYVVEYGWQKACEDAKQEWIKLRSRVAELEVADAENYCICGETMISHNDKTGHAAISFPDYKRSLGL